MLFRLETPEEDFWNVLEKRLSVDDLVYHGNLVAFHCNQLDCQAEDMPLNDVALYHLLNVGAHNMDTIDKPWDASTCSVRLTFCHLSGGSPLDHGRSGAKQGLCVLFLKFGKKLNMHLEQSFRGSDLRAGVGCSG